MARKPVRPELSGPGSSCRLAAVMVRDVRATAAPPLSRAAPGPGPPGAWPVVRSPADGAGHTGQE